MPNDLPARRHRGRVFAASLCCILAAPAAPARAALNGTRVFLLGIDGADWRFIDPLLAQGRLPHLKSLIEAGCSASLDTDIAYSPVTWTTIATGKNRDKHGVEVGPEEGMPRRTERKVKAIWNILGDKGARVLVSSYLTTYPAEAVNGVLVSKEWLDDAEDRPDGTYPADAFAPFSREQLRSAVDAAPLLIEDDAGRPPSYSAQRREERRFFGLNGTADGDFRAAWTAKHFLSRERFDFFAIHFWGVDYACHQFFGGGLAAEAAGESKAAMADVIPRYYEYVDALVGDLLVFADTATVVMVVSDHGERANADPLVRRNGEWQQSGKHAPEGVVIAAGPHVRRCAGREANASVVDVAPTILYAMGLAQAKDMDGRALTTFFDSGFAAAHPVQTVATYESDKPRGAPSLPPPPAQRAFEALKRAGYVQ